MSKYQSPLPAPFKVGELVRYMGASFNSRNGDDNFTVSTGDTGKCVDILYGWRGGVFLSSYNCIPEFSDTVHDRSVILLDTGYKISADAEIGGFQRISDDLLPPE